MIGVMTQNGEIYYGIRGCLFAYRLCLCVTSCATPLLVNYTIHLGSNIIEYSESKCHPQETRSFCVPEKRDSAERITIFWHEGWNREDGGRTERTKRCKEKI
jgi:hypothetical protein